MNRFKLSFLLKGKTFSSIENLLVNNQLITRENISTSRNSFYQICKRRFSSTNSSKPKQTPAEKMKALPEPESPQPTPSVYYFRSGPVTWGSLFLLVATGASLIVYYDREKVKRLQTVKALPSVGKAAIGGPFNLINEDGKNVSEKDLVGSWNLLYFGFTFCPDICPAELEKMADAVNIVEKKANIQIRPVFISIDPERDTPDQIKSYVKEFHPRMMGLTGAVESVKAVAREYRVYYMKTEEDEDGDYLVDHSIIMYLMDPNMNFVKFFGKNFSNEELANGIIEEIKAWKKENADALTTAPSMESPREGRKVNQNV